MLSGAPNLRLSELVSNLHGKSDAESTRRRISEYGFARGCCFAEFAKASNLVEAIGIAALCQTKDHGRHPHQRRISRPVLVELQACLLQCSKEIAAVVNFSVLHTLVERECNHIHGAGELLAYDVAYRIGHFLGKEPTLVYLHAGTRIGARCLGFRGKTIKLHNLPEPVRPLERLTPAQAEDFLCIYNDQLCQ